MDIASKPPRLLAQVRAAIRVHQLSQRTEQAYLGWVRRYVRFHRLRHPATMGTDEVVAFLSHLATEGQVVQSTQMQALSALLLLYRDVVGAPWIAQWRPVEISAEPPVCPTPGTYSSRGCSFRDQIAQAPRAAQDELAARIHAEIRTRSYSWKTEATYRHWAQRLLAFSQSSSAEGIPPEKVGLLFQKFQQLDGANTRRAGGTGLGLAIVKALVEVQGGRVSVKSEVGSGTTFTVTVPVAK